MVFSFSGLGAAEAHKVSIFAWAEEGTVHTQSKFSGGKKVKNGKVEVFDTKGNLLLEGFTNGKGEFSFNAPAITEMNIVLTAGMGHKNKWTLTADELERRVPEPVAPEPVPSEIEKEPLPYPSGESKSNPSSTSGNETTNLSAKDVEIIVARQLEQKLAPITRMLVDKREKGPTVTDIFGGIGYILGLVGVGAYVRYRKDDRRS